MVGIKGMKIPDNCWECDLAVDSCSGYTICAVNGEVLFPMCSKIKKLKHCPLVDIKETIQNDSYH